MFWSSTDFESDELTRYAEQFMEAEVSQGVAILGRVTLLLLIATSFLYKLLEYSELYLYTCMLLGVMCIHVIFSSRRIPDTKALYLLCMTLIIVSATAFVLLAHRDGNFYNILLPSVVVLLMVIPIVPWGLREGLAIVLLIYLVFTMSTFSVEGRFSSDNLMVLQFMMLVSAMISLTILSRNVAVRKDDIKARFELEVAHRKMERLSYKDGLTDAWNRRYLEVQFKRVVNRMLGRCRRKVYFGLFDIDDFKLINDVHGHQAGDDILKEIADVFQQSLGESSYLFRIGGDEFVILFEASDYKIPLQQVTDKLREQSIAGPRVNLSIGILEIRGPGSEIELEKLYKEADISLYKAKSRKYSIEDELNCVSSSILVAEAT